jgi:hypothetical protein
MCYKDSNILTFRPPPCLPPPHSLAKLPRIHRLQDETQLPPQPVMTEPQAEAGDRQRQWLAYDVQLLDSGSYYILRSIVTCPLLVADVR